MGTEPTRRRTRANSGRRIVVTGLGCVSPLGNDVATTWGAALEGKSGAGPITHFDASRVDCRIACEVKNFDPEKYINKKDARRMDRMIQMGVAAGFQALDQAGVGTLGHVDKTRVGVLMSSGIGGIELIENQFKIALDNPGRVSPFFIPGAIINMIAGQISIMRGLQGPSYGVVSACSSSAHAIGEAARLIERGDCDIVVAGGSEAAVTLSSVSGFANMKALSTRNDAPEKASRPFDVNRDGFVMGEGAAALILESLESAQARGAQILGEFVGYGTNSDAFHMTNPSENGVGAATCMKLALEDAGLTTADIDHVNMHGTSTPAGDVAETAAVKSVFGSRAQNLHLCSTKSMTGHLLGATGALEALFTVLTLKEGKIPPTINLDNPDPSCDLNYTAHRMQSVALRAALSNSFGFGGTNVTLAFKKFS